MVNENKLKRLLDRADKSENRLAVEMGELGWINRYGEIKDRSNIPRYLSGVQEMPLKTAVMLCTSLNSSIDEIVMSLYPDMEYCRKVISGSLFANELMNNLTDMTEKKSIYASDSKLPCPVEQTDIKDGARYTEITSRAAGRTDNRLIICSDGGISDECILTELKRALKEDRNIFITLTYGNRQITDSIKEAVSACKQYRIYETSGISQKIDWFSSINEPESIELLAYSVSRSMFVSKGNPLEPVMMDYIRKVLQRALWNNDRDRPIEDRIKEASAYIQKDSCKEGMTGPALSYFDDFITAKVAEFFNGFFSYEKDFVLSDIVDYHFNRTDTDKRYVILAEEEPYIDKPDIANLIGQYLRILSNIKSHGSDIRDSRKYAVIFSETNPLRFIPARDITSWYRAGMENDINFVMQIKSLTQLKDIVGEDAFPSVLNVYTRGVYTDKDSDEWFENAV